MAKKKYKFLFVGTTGTGISDKHKSGTVVELTEEQIQEAHSKCGEEYQRIGDNVKCTVGKPLPAARDPRSDTDKSKDAAAADEEFNARNNVPKKKAATAAPNNKKAGAADTK